MTDKNLIITDLGDIKPVIIAGGKSGKFVPNLNMSFHDDEFFINLNRRDKVISDDLSSISAENATLPGNDSDIFYIDSDGRFKWDIEFDKKPDSNIFTWELKYSAGIEFLYQGELTEWEKSRGNYRAPEVVGSYAVYCNKKNNKYKSGKICHIYRPFCYDSNNNTVYADLLIEKNSLTIKIPQDYIDKATYPVRLDPTLGYNTAGASWDGPATGYALYGNYTNQATEDGTAQKLYGYFRYQTSAQDTTLALYDRGIETPHNVIDTGTVSVNSSSGAWFSADVSGDITEDAYYIVALLTQSRLQQAYDSGGSSGNTFYNAASSFVNDPSVSYSTIRLSTYLEYGAPTFTVTGSHTLGGLTQTGSVTVTSAEDNLSGSHTLGGLTQSGSATVLNPVQVTGAHTLSGLTHSGSLAQISIATKLALLSNKRMWFAHQSVGNYMTHGPADDDAHGVALIAANNPGYISVVSEPANIGAIDRGDFAESYNGTNFFPYDKLSDFDTAIRTTFAGGYLDFAIFKFCWVDFYLANSEIKTTGDADTFWTTYKYTIDSLISDFPNTRFILCTVPVTPNNSDSGNALREYFSGLIRTEYAAQGIVFDLADWESRNASRQLELYGGYRELNNAWDIGDGGHPNNDGSDMLAYELITQLADLAAGINVIEGSHTLGGLAQSGSITVGDVNTISGAHTLSGLTQTGSVTETAAPRTISGSHILTGLIQSGSIEQLPIVFGSHILSGIIMSGNLLNSTPIVISVIKTYDANIELLLDFDTEINKIVTYVTEV